MNTKSEWKSPLPEINNHFVQEYLRYVEETESPRLFHVWACISGLGSCMGRRVYFPFGDTRIYPNMYVVLVGDPAVRKSHALGPIRKILTNTTKIKLAPDDTAGQRQGLISAFLAGSMTDQEDQEIEDAMQNTFAAGTTPQQMLASVETGLLKETNLNVLYAIASEFTSIIGTNTPEMLTFLQKLWDGDSYVYQLKNEKTELTDPLLSIIGCSTPQQLALSLPSEAGGQGFLSRVVFVHGAEKYKNLARPQKSQSILGLQLEEVYHYVFYNMQGSFNETELAASTIDDLYGKIDPIEDHRFNHYMERRHTHLIKLTMCLAAGRKSNIITVEDVKDAQFILSETEKLMPEALGEFGLSPMSQVRQTLLSVLKKEGVISVTELWTKLQRDTRKSVFAEILEDFTTTGIVEFIPGDGTGGFYQYIKRSGQKEQRGKMIQEMLASKEESKIVKDDKSTKKGKIHNHVEHEDEGRKVSSFSLKDLAKKKIVEEE